MEQFIGVDIGGTKCAITLGNRDGDCIVIKDKIKFPTDASKGACYSIGLIMNNIGRLLENNKKLSGDIMGIGISCGGPLDIGNGIILSPPNLPGWDNIPITEIMEEKFGIRTHMQNDANACALAEWKFGVGKGCSNMIFLTFGTGMGAGLILGGRLYAGTNGMAGEVGHVRLSENGPVGYGKAGSFEGFCSGGGIAQLAKSKVMEKLQMGQKPFFCEGFDQLDKLDAKIIADAAESGDELAKEIYALCGTYLGRGLSVLIDILNPEVVVIGSIFSRSRELLWPSAKAVIERETLIYNRSVCRILPSALGEQIGDFAALAVAMS